MELTRTDWQAAADALRAVLTSVESGELTCSAALRHRLEGAALALEAEVSAVA